jgi:flagellum-specific peptidoglycan hydrolase FlgJ
MAGGGGKTPSSTTQTAELPAWARGYAKDVLAKGAALTDINSNPYVKYGGERLAGFSPMQQQSFNSAQNMQVAPQIGLGSAYAAQSGQYSPVGQQYTGSNVNQYMNPYLQGALAPQLREAAAAGMEAQNMNAAKAVGMGAFGGTRGALQKSLTEKSTMQNMADINAKGYSDAFNQAANMFNVDQQRRIQEAQYGNTAQQQAADLLSRLGGQQFQQGMDINKLQNVYGQQQQSQAQKAADIGYQDFMDQQNYAYKQLGFMSDLIKNPAIGSTSQRQMYENNSGNDLATLGGLGALGKGAGLFREGGVVGYADGGDITSYVKRLSDDQLATALKQAQQEQDQERIMALTAEMQYRQEVRGAQAMPQEQPMDQGLAALPAGPMPQMASGGIVAFAEGATVKGDPKARFMEEYGPAAEYAGKRLGVDPQVLLAQWGLETGWGKSVPGKYNVGNMKASANQPGTRGYDKAEKSNDRYVDFQSPEEFGAAYADRIARLWPDAMGAGSDAAKYADALTSGKRKYATDKNYVSKVADAYEGLGGTPQAQAQEAPRAMSYSPNVAAIPGAAVDPRQTFMGPTSPNPKGDWETKFGGMGRIPGVLEAGLTLAANTGAIPLSGIQSLLGDKSFDENYRENVYAPRTDTATGLIQGAADVAEFLKIPPYIPFIGTAGQSTRALAEARRGAKDVARGAEVGKTLTALAEKKVELPRLPGATTSAAEAKVAAPRLPSTPEDTSFMGRVRSGLADITRRDTDQAAADAARAERQPGGLDDVARLKKDQKDAAELKQGTARLAEEARLGPIKVQDETLRLGDRADDALYAQGVADRTGKVGRLGLGAIAATNATNASSEDMPSGLAAAQAAALDPEDLSKDDKKDVVDAAKKALPDSVKKGSGFTNDDWLMLGLQMLKNNVGNKGFGQILGESGLPTLMNKKEREKMEREQESQGFVDQYRQSQAELNRAQADYFGEGKKVREADAAVETRFKNWLEGQKANKMTVMNLTPEMQRAEYDKILREVYGRYKLPVPASLGAASVPAAVPEGTKVTRIG